MYDVKIKQLKERPNSNAELKGGIEELTNEVETRKEVASKLRDLQTKVYH